MGKMDVLFKHDGGEGWTFEVLEGWDPGMVEVVVTGGAKTDEEDDETIHFVLEKPAVDLLLVALLKVKQ